MTSRLFGNIVRYVLGVYLALTLLEIGLSPWLSFTERLSVSPWTPFLIIGSFALGLLCCVVAAKVKKVTSARKANSKRVFIWRIGIGTAILFLLQLFIVHECAFVTGWDPGTIADFGNYDEHYFSIYPNQLFLTGVFSALNDVTCLFVSQRGYTTCVVVGCLHASLSVFLISSVARKLRGNTAGFCCFILSFVFVGLSPWILVPYSDIYGMFWTTLALFCYCCVDRRSLKWAGIVFATIIGYAIKPTALFVLAAILVVELFSWLGKKRNKGLDNDAARESRSLCAIFPSVILVCLAAVIGFCLVAGFKDFGISLNEEESFSFTHYLMMGANPETGGSYSVEDKEFSESLPTQEERKRANLQVWTQRLSDMGPGGIGSLLAEKNVRNYGDGTFSWEGEGGFYKVVYGHNDAMQGFYGIGDGRDNLFAPFFQVMWFMILVGVIAVCFTKAPGKVQLAAMISILLLSTFLLVFECRARYLLLFVPFYVLLGVLGWKSVAGALSVKFQRTVGRVLK